MPVLTAISLLLFSGCRLKIQTPEFKRGIADYLEWAVSPSPEADFPGREVIRLLGSTIYSAGALELSEALEEEIESRGRWSYPDRSVVLLAPGLTSSTIVRLFGDRQFIADAARQTLQQSGTPVPAGRLDEVAPEVELMGLLLSGDGAARTGAISHWINREEHYDRLVLLPDHVTAACRALLEGVSQTGLPGPGAALERLAAARVLAPANRYLFVRGLYFRSASSLRIDTPAPQQARLLQRLEEGLLDIPWEQWWAHSRSGPSNRTMAGTVEFDFWPLVLDGRGPTKVGISIRRPVTVSKSQGRLSRIDVELADDGSNQLAGRAHWLLETGIDGGSVRVHSVFDHVYPAANYHSDWRLVERVSWETLDLDRVFGQMHVWVEDDDGPLPVVERLSKDLRGLVVGVAGLHDEPVKSGLPGLADWALRQHE